MENTRTLLVCHRNVRRTSQSRIIHVRIASENTQCARGWTRVNTIAQQNDFKRQDFRCRGTRYEISRLLCHGLCHCVFIDCFRCYPRRGRRTAGPAEGPGRAHMDISCSPAVAAKFDRALALLHNFRYSRALEGFQQVSSADSQCAMAYWGAAMTYNHPFWDAPSASDESGCSGFCAKGNCSEGNVPAREALSERDRRSV
jgi:hypothetical protein